MIPLNTPGNIDLSQCRVVGSARRFDWANKKPFVSCFRVKEGFENRKNYKVTKLPPELYALFQQNV